MVKTIKLYVPAFLLLFLLFSYPLSALPVPLNGLSEVKAKDVSFDGKKIILTGEVIIEGKLGTITCEKAELFLAQQKESKPNEASKQASGPSLAPERILLQENVVIKLSDQSHLTADQADLNCVDLEGVFTAKSPHKVVYIAYVDEAEGVKVPVKTSSRTMRVKLKKEENGSGFVLSDVQGEGSVTIEYQPKGML